MAKEFTLSIVAPDHAVLEDVVVHSVIAPSQNGYFGVMGGHEPTIFGLRPGIVEYHAGNQRHFVNITGGFAEFVDNKFTILADAAESATEIDVARAQAALENARRALRGEVSGMTTEAAAAEVERAATRLKVAQKA